MFFTLLPFMPLRALRMKHFMKELFMLIPLEFFSKLLNFCEIQFWHFLKHKESITMISDSSQRLHPFLEWSPGPFLAEVLHPGAGS